MSTMIISIGSDSLVLNYSTLSPTLTPTAAINVHMYKTMDMPKASEKVAAASSSASAAADAALANVPKTCNDHIAIQQRALHEELLSLFFMACINGF